MLYAETTPKLRAILGENRASLKGKYHPDSIRLWLNGTRDIALYVLEELFKDSNMWELLDNTQIRSRTFRRTIKIKHKITTQEAIILAWILAEGSLGIYRISISQSKKRDLEALKSLIIESFNINSEYVNIYPDKAIHSLRLPTVFKDYFHQKYNIPIGNKSKIIRIPKQIFKANSEVKKAFLAAYIETDGSICFYRRTLKSGVKYRAPRINIGSASKGLIKDAQRLFKSLGYNPRLYFSETHKYYMTQLSKAKEVEKLFYDIRPYMLCEDKISKYRTLISEYKELKVKLL